MAALHRAVALAEVDRVAVTVGKHLDFDMPRIEDGAFENHVGIAECALRLRLGAAQRAAKILSLRHETHAATAAGDGLDHQRITQPSRLAGETLLILIALESRHAGNADLRHERLRASLVAHGQDRGWRRADEHQPRLVTGAGEVLVLGEKAITRMDRIGARGLRRSDDRRDAQIGLRWQRLTDADGLVGLTDVARTGVRCRVNGHGLVAQLAHAANHAQRDLAAIGDQHFLEWGRLHGRATENCIACGCRASASRHIESV